MLKPLQHPIIALILQLVIGITTGNWWIGAAFGSGYFVGREYAQAEQRVIEHFYDNLRSNAPFWCALQLRAWTAKGITDFVYPTITVICAAYLVTKFLK